MSGQVRGPSESHELPLAESGSAVVPEVAGTARSAEVAGLAWPAGTPDDRYARAVLSFLAEPGEPALGTLLRSLSPAEIVRALSSAETSHRAALAARYRRIPGIDRAVDRWRAKLGQVPSAARLAAWERGGFRLACPGDPEWPTQLDDLGDGRPVVLWLRGSADLRYLCLRSVSMVGSRAASAYGSHVATEFSAGLTGLGWNVVSGGAFGIDAAAHRGALVVGGCTVAVLASGLNFGYPKGHHELFRAIGGTGVLVSECPPDQAPTRPGFLVRNRVIAALSRGTVVVEAALRSGALSTARHARELNRPVMAVPGPVTSDQSAGCNQLLRDASAACVTSVRDVIEMIAPLGQAAGEEPSHDPAVPAEDLDPVTASVLAAVTQRTGRGPATIATLAGVDLDTAMRCLGLLAAAGHVERCDRGWRTRKPG